MSARDIAGLLGAHMTLSTPASRIWLRVARGELSMEEAARLRGEDALPERLEGARRVFEPMSARRTARALHAVRGQLELRARKGARRGWSREVVALVVAARIQLLRRFLVVASAWRWSRGTDVDVARGSWLDHGGEVRPWPRRTTGSTKGRRRATFRAPRAALGIAWHLGLGAGGCWVGWVERYASCWWRGYGRAARWARRVKMRPSSRDRSCGPRRSASSTRGVRRSGWR